MSQWYCLVQGRRYGPLSREQLQAWILAGRVRASDLVWAEGLPDWRPASEVEQLRPKVAGGSVPPPPPPAGTELPNKKVLAGVLGIVFGALGVHKFYLGYTQAGVIMLVVSVATCGVGATPMAVIGLIEGIMYITMPEDRFEQTYIVGRKAWF